MNNISIIIRILFAVTLFQHINIRFVIGNLVPIIHRQIDKLRSPTESLRTF
jgi:hypothetical protein